MLHEIKQAQAISAAVCIDGSDDGVHKVLLYQIDKFYVEVYYHKETNVIKRYRSFESTNQLAPYLSKIDISKALSNL